MLSRRLPAGATVVVMSTLIAEDLLLLLLDDDSGKLDATTSPRCSAVRC